MVVCLGLEGENQGVQGMISLLQATEDTGLGMENRASYTH
jgi:hypothetical protein